MGYRDDHAAAIARIDALEGELGTLREENAELRRENTVLTERAASLTRQASRAAASASDDATAADPPPGLVTRALKLIATVALAAGIVVGLIGAWFGIKACFAPGGAFGGPALSGALIATGPALGGDFTFVPGTCSSGAHTQFYGVDLFDKTDPRRVLRVIEDPVQGRFLKMFFPPERARFLDPPSCTVWEWTVTPQNTTYNDVRLLDGHIGVECTFPEGGTIKGRIEFKGCR